MVTGPKQSEHKLIRPDMCDLDDRTWRKEDGIMIPSQSRDLAFPTRGKINVMTSADRQGLQLRLSPPPFESTTIEVTQVTEPRAITPQRSFTPG